MKKTGQKFLYLCKLSSTKFDLESNWNILNEKRRPEFPISLQSFLNEIRFRFKPKLSEWNGQARNTFKISSTEFDLESNLNILNEKDRPEIPISLQTFLNEIRFRIKLKHSEWKTQARISSIFAKFPQRNSIWNQIETIWMKNAGQIFLYFCKIFSKKFDLESNWNILNKNACQNFLYLCKISSTKFDLESNCNFLNEKSRPESPSNFPQGNSI